MNVGGDRGDASRSVSSRVGGPDNNIWRPPSVANVFRKLTGHRRPIVVGNVDGQFDSAKISAKPISSLGRKMLSCDL